MTFIKRRISNNIALILVSFILYALAKYYALPLYKVQLWSGWLLITLIFLLFIYSIKKKLNLLPLGKASSWLQFHSYAGFLSLFIFLQHISFQIPNGFFDLTLTLFFLGTAISGVIGLVFSRVIPKYLSQRGEEVIFERIPLFTHELTTQAHTLVIECTSQTQSTAVADYYQNHLANYFRKPRNIFPHLYGSMCYLNKLQSKHTHFCRYLNAQERDYAEQLFELVKKKYDLDFHYALQGLLKTWLFIHVPLTYSLIIAATAHLMLIYAFIGNL